MKIKSIEVKNIKGISQKKFSLDLTPNKPNILVAPNGFGKSSFAIAFKSLNRNRIDLDKTHYYLGDDNNLPAITIEVEDGDVTSYTATHQSNLIKDQFDIFVINNQVVNKAKLSRNAGGTNFAVSSLEIEPTVLVKSIPAQKEFGYHHPEQKRNFGAAGKILPNIADVLSNTALVESILSRISFEKFDGGRLAVRINNIFDEIKLQTATAPNIKAWIAQNKIQSLTEITELNTVAELLSSALGNKVDAFLAAYQLIEVYKSLGKTAFNNVIKYAKYLDEKTIYTELIQTVNSTRFDLKPEEDNGKLIIKWPKATEISNGQRDVLTLISLFLSAQNNFQKQNCILIIDEVFDYLDDANLVTFQYYITKMIETMKDNGKKLFPLLMTHLDPIHFKHFCFNKHKLKICYLQDVAASTDSNLLKLIQNRENPTIKQQVSEYFLHYHSNAQDLSSHFSSLGIQGIDDTEKFKQKINVQKSKYQSEDNNYCPLYICIALRKHIEEILYNKIQLDEQKRKFLDEHGTKNKLEYCETIGVDIPEVFYLLGIIYNDNLHIRGDANNIIKPLAIKLENKTIRKLINDVFSMS